MTATLRTLRLGVNVDHVATVRNARGGVHPDPARAALAAIAAGADLITAHLREDRRHITDDDAVQLRARVAAPFNLEIASTAEMVEIACRVKPDFACLVPERRAERTTEGGLDVLGQRALIEAAVARLRAAGVLATLFVEPAAEQVRAARDVGAHSVELHTGRYCDARGEEQARQLARLDEAARLAVELGLECHAGHGLDYDNVGPVASIPAVTELNIGHFLVGEALFVGLAEAIMTMRERIDAGMIGAVR